MKFNLLFEDIREEELNIWSVLDILAPDPPLTAQRLHISTIWPYPGPGSQGSPGLWWCFWWKMKMKVNNCDVASRYPSSQSVNYTDLLYISPPHWQNTEVWGTKPIFDTLSLTDINDGNQSKTTKYEYEIVKRSGDPQQRHSSHPQGGTDRRDSDPLREPSPAVVRGHPVSPPGHLQDLLLAVFPAQPARPLHPAISPSASRRQKTEKGLLTQSGAKYFIYINEYWNIVVFNIIKFR